MVQHGLLAGRQHFLRGAQQPAQGAAAAAAQYSHHALDLAVGDVEAEGIGGGVFQVMGLVNDQVIVVGQHPVAGSHIGQEQGMIHHQDVSRLGCHAHSQERAGAAGVFHAGVGGAALVF